MKIEDIKNQLEILHNREDELNKIVSKIDKRLKGLIHEKQMVSRKISINMKARNWLIKKLP